MVDHINFASSCLTSTTHRDQALALFKHGRSYKHAAGSADQTAIEYVERIKTRYKDDPHTYRLFLKALYISGKDHNYDKVNRKVECLFNDAPDLLAEFTVRSICLPIGKRVGRKLPAFRITTLMSDSGL